MEAEPPSSRRPSAGPRRPTPTGLVLQVALRSEAGAVRSSNEDTAFLAAGGRVMGVCDGMGGANGGEVASALAAEAIGAELEDAVTAGPITLAALERAVLRASREVYERALARADLKGMGTTATVAAWAGREVFVAHVGDSRAYLVRDGSITQITRDHTLVELFVSRGQLTREEAKSSPYQHVIVQAVGTQPAVEVELHRLTVREGDAVMVCSDGVTGWLDDAAIAEIIERSPDPATACDTLAARAIEAGSTDNVTCVVARIARK